MTDKENRIENTKFIARQFLDEIDKTRVSMTEEEADVHIKNAIVARHKIAEELAELRQRICILEKVENTLLLAQFKKQIGGKNV